MNRWLRVAVVAFGLSSAALAVSPGDTLYIRSRNTRVLKEPGSSKVVKVLQPGATVVWLGVHPKKGWHQVEIEIARQKFKGVVLAANLSVKPPPMEILATSGERAKDANAFLSSGAATKALGPGAVAYGEKKDMKEAVTETIAMETLSKSVTTPEVAAHAKKRGLPEVVGPVAVGGDQ